jgi:hypothetical protein
VEGQGQSWAEEAAAGKSGTCGKEMSPADELALVRGARSIADATTPQAKIATAVSTAKQLAHGDSWASRMFRTLLDMRSSHPAKAATARPPPSEPVGQMRSALGTLAWAVRASGTCAARVARMLWAGWSATGWKSKLVFAIAVLLILNFNGFPPAVGLVDYILKIIGDALSFRWLPSVDRQGHGEQVFHEQKLKNAWNSTFMFRQAAKRAPRGNETSIPNSVFSHIASKRARLNMNADFF